MNVFIHLTNIKIFERKDSDANLHKSSYTIKNDSKGNVILGLQLLTFYFLYTW